MLGNEEVGVHCLCVPAQPLKHERPVSELGHALTQEPPDLARCLVGDPVGWVVGLRPRSRVAGMDKVSVLQAESRSACIREDSRTSRHATDPGQLRRNLEPPVLRLKHVAELAIIDNRRVLPGPSLGL